jgi:hypothetical protein
VGGVGGAVGLPKAGGTRNNEANLDYTRFNNIRRYDVGHCSVDNVLDHLMAAQVAQQELGPGAVEVLPFA